MSSWLHQASVVAWRLPWASRVIGRDEVQAIAALALVEDPALDGRFHPLRNATIDRVRSYTHRRSPASVEYEPEVDGVDESADPEQRALIAELLGRLIPGLPTRERVILVRHYLDGEPLYLIAKDLGISKGWASRILDRTLLALRVEIEAILPPLPDPADGPANPDAPQ